MIKANEVKLNGMLQMFRVNPDGSRLCLFEDHNEIRSGYAEYAINRLVNQNVNHAIDTLFTDDNLSWSSPGSQDGRDGIVCGEQSVTYLTTITTNITSIHSFGERWKGDITFDGAQTVDRVALGHGFTSGPSAEGFDALLASRSIPTESMQSSDRIIFEWELYIT